MREQDTSGAGVFGADGGYACESLLRTRTQIAEIADGRGHHIQRAGGKQIDGGHELGSKARAATITGHAAPGPIRTFFLYIPSINRDQNLSPSLSMKRVILFSTLTCLLAGTAWAANDAAAEARAAAAIGNYREAADLYLAAARDAKADLATDYKLRAAEALLSAKAPEEVEAVLRRLPPSSLNSTRAQLAGLLKAQARFAQGDAAGALQALPSSVDSSIAATALALRADALFATGDSLAGTTARVLREQVIIEADRNANRDALWRNLQTAPLPPVLPNSTEPLVRGWIELARLARSNAGAEELNAWLGRNYRHPAAERLSSLGAAGHPAKGRLADLVSASLKEPADAAGANPAAETIGTPANASSAEGGIALLLPLSGKLAVAAQAIRLGAIAAMNHSGPNAPILQIHDTGAGLPAVLAAALASDAKGLIGPLVKEQVQALAALAPSLPVLALNYPDQATPANIVPFGLAPEDEARSAAADAARSGLRGALLLSLEGDWGDRAAAAFRAAFTQAGGAVVAEGKLKPNLNDYGPALKPLLGISAAESRNHELAALGINAELEAQPRSDVDVIFLALRGRQARLVVPALKFLNGGNLAIYGLAAASDSGLTELANVRICDAPWRQDKTELAPLHETLLAVNPKGADTQRLFALGYDAYMLALKQQSDAGLGSGRVADGLTGTLMLEGGEVHRHLACLLGRPVSSEESDASAAASSAHTQPKETFMAPATASTSAAPAAAHKASNPVPTLSGKPAKPAPPVKP